MTLHNEDAFPDVGRKLVVSALAEIRVSNILY